MLPPAEASSDVSGPLRKRDRSAWENAGLMGTAKTLPPARYCLSYKTWYNGKKTRITSY